MLGNKIYNKITKSAIKSEQNNPATNANEHDKEIPKEKYKSPEERQETVDEMVLKQYNKGISKNNKIVRQFNKSTN